MLWRKSMRFLSLLCACLMATALLAGCHRGSASANNGGEEETNSANNAPAEKPAGHGEIPKSIDICFEAQNRRVPVLMFHDLILKRGKGTEWFDCTVDEFKEILDAIEEEGLTPISMDQLYEHLSSGKAIPEKSVVLTFDDNYQSFYDMAWPLLKEKKYPACVFVHTAFVGQTTGRAKMSWETLKELVKDPLFTVGGHTINHFEDLKDRDPATQRDELTISKDVLEKNLDLKIAYLAYPNGSNDEQTQILAQEAGYKMAVTIVNTPAEESPNIFAVGRYVHTKYKTAFEDCEKARTGAPSEVFRVAWKPDAPVRYVTGKFDGIPLRMVFGGHPTTVLAKNGRQPVMNFVRDANAAAGINGGFFAMAAVDSLDNAMVGPLKTADMPQVIPDTAPERWVKINNRPLVIWSGSEFALLPYVPSQMNKPEQYEYFMKGYTDSFMGGVWLVHGGIAREKDLQSMFGAKDIQDPRRRAFIGVTQDGQFVAGTATDSVSSEKLAKAAAEAGVYEAVLIDSGFSTSLVFNGKIKASGHANKDHPSRPVPHAIVIQGKPDLTTDDAEDLSSATSLEPTKRVKKKKKR